MQRSIKLLVIATIIHFLFSPISAFADDILQQSETAMEKAVNYFYNTVSTKGGYLWFYSEDLSYREGEGKATETQIWVQPPGTPAVGSAYLRAYERTGCKKCLEAAKAAADALVWGQLESGGWDYKIDFDPKGSKRWYYRRNKDKEKTKKQRNYSVFDDNNTQSAMRFLMAVHKVTGNEKYKSAIDYGLKLMLKSQFDKGAWPQVYPLPSKGYSRWYTFNDNAMNDCINVMLDAYKMYGNQEYIESVKRGGDFIIKSQLPVPQAGWAQQYNYDMKPVPARWFEPAAVNGSVTPRNIKTLIKLYLETGEDKYIRPIPAAIDWLERSKLEDKKWARFYELGTNKPIYVNMDREVVYEFINIRPGYSWMGNYASSAISLYQKVKSMGREKYLEQSRKPMTDQEKKSRLANLQGRVKEIIENQDDQGRWIKEERIYCSDFISNLNRLSEYISLARDINSNR
ncbi:hypothetical protein GF312_08325 [Candidatus Poribacteria bacterium]|nr:hypothetical protein [Candidatus Poribacteria bacterium]